MAINNNIEDPKYRKKIYDFLSTNFADFKRTEADFYKKLDSDSNYAGQVYDVISQNYSDFGRPRAEFLELMLPSKKKELSEVASPIGGEAGISAPPSDSGKGFGGLKPAERQPAEVIKEPKVVGEDTLLTRKMEQAQRPAISTTGVRLPAAPKVVAEEKAAERALAPKVPIEDKKGVDKGLLEQAYTGLSNIASSISRGAAGTMVNTVDAIGTLIKQGERYINRATLGIDIPEGFDPMAGVPGAMSASKVTDYLANKYNRAVDELFPQTPEFKNSIADQLGQGLGQVTGIILTSGAGGSGMAARVATAEQLIPRSLVAGKGVVPVAAAQATKQLVSGLKNPATVIGGLNVGQQEFKRAKDAGATDDQAFEAFYKNALTGSVLEQIPVMQFFKRFNQYSKGGVVNYLKTKAVGGITGGVEEMTTEIMQQLYANKTAKDIYNINQDLLEGMGSSGGIGFGVGFILNALGAKAKVLRNEGKIEDAKLLENQKLKFEQKFDQQAEQEKSELAAKGVVFEKPEVPAAAEELVTPTEEIKAEVVEPEVAPQVPAAEEKTYRVEYFDPESRKMTHQMFATEAEGEAFKKTLTREQASQGVTSYFEKAPAKGVGEIAPEATPQVPAAAKKPTEEQQLKDIQEGNLATFTYENESQVPEAFKDKISSRGEINGKPYVKVTVAKSLADYELGKAEGVGEVAPKAAPEVPAAPAKVEPIRQLGTGANVYFENENYRVNDFRDKVLLNVSKAGDAGIVVNLEFNTPEEAVDVAKTLNRLYPKGVPEAVLLDKVVEDIKAGKYEEVAGEVAPEAAAPETKEEIIKKYPELKNTKAVDNEGKPLLLYHGGVKFDDFKPSQKKEDKGIYFTDNKELALFFAHQAELVERDKRGDDYSDIPEELLKTGEPFPENYFKYAKIHKAYLDMKNPTVVDAIDAPSIPRNYEPNTDGFIAKSTGDFGYKGGQYVVFNPKQIKKVISELPAAPEKTQDEVAKEQTKETDLLLGGQAEQRRKDGKYTKDGVEYVRNPKGQGIASEVTGEVRFTNEVSLPFKYKLVEAETLQPSHQDGIRNPLHFIPEAQPKNRNDVGSLQAEESFANNPRFSELGENTNAYSGAPVVNERGEVVQGNNRSAGLRKGYQRNNPQYKNDLAANAEQFGFTREQVEGMKNPVLVREVAVSDQGAVELGNYDAKDLETGGKRRIDPIAVTRRMPFDVKGRISDLFTGEETLNQAIRANQKRLLELLNPYLNQAQRNTITKDGALTDAGIKDLEAVVQQFLFDNGDTALPDLFENLSATQKEGLRKSLPYVFSVSPEKSLVPDIQEAILAVNDFNASGAGEFDAWLLQGDIFNDGKTPKDKYTPLELAIAKALVESKTQKEIAKKFADYADVVKDKEADMFEAARPGKSRKEGVLEIFKAEDYAKPISERGRKEAAPEKKPTPEPSAEKRAREAKREPRLPETEKRAEARKELRDAFNDLMNLGVAYDPRSQAEKQVRLTRAIINVIKQEAIGAIKDLKKYIKDNVGFDISDNDAKYLLIESKKPEYAIQEPTAGKVPVQPKARAGEKVEAGVPPTRPPKPPKEGEVEGETGAEKKSVELSLKGIKEIANEFSIEDVEGRTRKTDIELRENAKDKIDKWVAEGSYDKNIDNLVKKAEDFDVLTDEQRIILEQHLANVRENFSNGIENGTIKAGSEEFTNGLNQIKRLLDAASKTRSAAGAALRIPIGGSVAHPLENYDTALVAKMDANSVDKLTDAQIKEVEESVRLYKEKIDAANERIKDLEDKLSQMMAEEEVNSVKKRKKAIKSKEERVAERKQAIADAREALKKIRTGEAGLSAVPIPFVREFVAISPYVKKIAQSYIEEGVDNLNLLIDKIYEDFKDDLPEMTKKDVRDIIGNQYSQRKETATEAKSKLKDFTEEARLLSLYEKLLSGEEPVSERKKIERNQRIVELRDKINEIRRRNKEQDVDYKDLKRIEDTKNRALQKAKEYKKKLDEKDFAPSEKPISIFNDTKLQKKYPKEYNEMLDAIQEREDAKHEFDIELMKDEERRQSKLQKIGRYAKMFTGTTKAIKSGIDASATLIQNFAMLSAYPKSYFKAFVNQWGDAASQKKFNRWHTAIKNNKPVWDLIQNSGLSITEPSALKEAQKEEIFSDNMLDRTFKIGDKTYNIGKYTTKPFERLFVSMGNALRVDVFLRIADKWYVEGITFETNPEDYKSLATMLNNMTSRAKLAPAVERARDIVGTGIWSPQLMASRLNLLGISDVAMPFFGRKGYYAGLTPKVRKMQIENMAKMIGLGLSIMLLAKVSGSDDDEGDLDPVSPTFGTVKVGEKRIPVWSNYPKYIRTIAQFASGKQKIEGKYADKRRGETAQRFFRSSVPPATGTAIDIITGRDYMGKPITKESVAKGLLMPMSLEAISKEVQRDGALGAVTGAAQFFGLNITDERDYVKKDDRPFEIKDPVTFKKREVTEKELELFKKRRDEIYKELSDDYENGRKTIYLNPEDKIKLSIPSSLSDTELDSWRELYYEKLTPEQIKELYKLLMSKAKKDSKNELKLTLGEEEEKED